MTTCVEKHSNPIWNSAGAEAVMLGSTGKMVGRTVDRLSTADTLNMKGCQIKRRIVLTLSQKTICTVHIRQQQS